MRIKFHLYIQSLLQNDAVKLSAIIIFICVIVYARFLGGGDYFIWSDVGSDTLNSYWPAYTYFSDALKNGPELLSLEIGLGTNLFSGSLLFFDPFMWLYAFANMIGIARLLIFVHILKLLIGALFFQRFLTYYINSKHVIFITALLYAFNGFMVVWGQHYYFGTIVMIFPMILLGIERAIHRQGFLLLSFSVALGLISSYYFMYMSIFFLAVFLPVRLFMLNGKNFKTIFRDLLIVAGAFLLGAGISGIVLFPTIAATFGTSRVKAQLAGISVFSLADIRTYLTMLGSLFSNNLLGSANNFTGAVNFYDSPHLYSGIVTLLVIPQTLFSRNTRGKVFIFCLLAFSWICLVFPYAAVVFNGFSTITYRWTYFVILILLVSGGLAFDRLTSDRSIHQPVLNISFHGLLLLAGMISLFYFLRRIPVSNEQIQISFSVVKDTLSRILPVILLVCAYYLLLKYYFRWKFAPVLLAVTVGVEVAWGTFSTFLGRTPVSETYVSQKQSYFDDSLAAVSKIKNDDPGLYRIDKFYLSQFWNDGMIQGYRNYHAYWSIVPESTISFYNAVGGISALNMQFGFIPSDTIRSLLSVKYYLVKSLNDRPPDYELISQVGEVYLLKNAHWVPMGAVYHSFISSSDFEKIGIPDRDQVLARACVIPDELVPTAQSLGLVEWNGDSGRSGTSASPLSTIEDLKKLASETLALTVSKDDNLQGSISTQTGGIMFLPINYDKGWEITINNEKQNSLNINSGLLGVFIKPGTHTVSLRYIPPLLREGAWATVFSLVLLLVISIVTRKIFSNPHSN